MHPVFITLKVLLVGCTLAADAFYVLSMIAGFRVRDAGNLIPSWGTGSFILRVYRATELLAEGPFSLS